MSLINSFTFTFMRCCIRKIYIALKDQTIWSQNRIVNFFFYIGLLLSVISISSKTSSNSDHVNCAFPIVLYKLALIRPISRSNLPPHYGALGTLSFHKIVSLLKKSWSFLSLLRFASHFPSALKVLALSGFPLLEISLLKLLINSVVVRLDTNSMCTALVTLQENSKIYALSSFFFLVL